MTIPEQGSLDLGEHAYRTFRTGRTIVLGSIHVRPIHVDHSIPAAYGFIVQTRGGVVGYTGDFPMHGPRADMTVDFVRAAKRAGVDVLVIDGTRVSRGEAQPVFSEADVKERARGIVEGSRGIALATFYPRDLDRLRTFYEVAVETGREFVISTKAAHLLESLKADRGIDLPRPGSESVRVYRRSKKTDYRWEKRSLRIAWMQAGSLGIRARC